MNHSLTRRLVAVLCLLVLCCGLLAACGGKKGKAPIPDGVYTAEFKTDGSMFHVNEVSEGRGVLTVENGEMTIHIIMPSKNIVGLFLGTAEDAQKEGAAVIEAGVETVSYPDGTSDEVNCFDVPVAALDQELPCAIVGTKGKWYNHTVVVSDPQPVENAG
jgi:major membrane immunogen (membrane-anchored lipoprotein)